MTERIICGDNLEVLKTLETESVDLCYIDPPFFSGKNYAVIFGDDEEVRQFDDRWIKENGKGKYTKDINVYLIWMEPRIKEIHRVLKKTGSFYLHCDWHADSYLRILCDKIFGYKKLSSKINWKRMTNKNNSINKFGCISDTILTYNKSKDFTFNVVYEELKHGKTDKHYKKDSNGKLYRTNPLIKSAGKSGGGGSRDIENQTITLDNKHTWIWSQTAMDEYTNKGNTYHWSKTGNPYYKSFYKGKLVCDIWNDIDYINPQSDEKLGYPTQKPEALLDRVVKASSNEGDVVLDAFCYSDDTEVLTHRGWVKFSDIHGDKSYEFLCPDMDAFKWWFEGRFVGTEEGKYERALEFYKYNNEKYLVRILLENDTEILVTKKHDIVCVSDEGLFIKKKAVDITIGDRIPTLTNFEPSNIIIFPPYDPINYTSPNVHSVVDVDREYKYGRSVYCVTLPDSTNHMLIVRRNDKVWICGNCGCGTTLAVAKKLNRQFIGIDVSPTSCRVMADRIGMSHEDVEGLPLTPEEITELSGWEFQNWINREFGAINGKRGADGGIDGMYNSTPIQVKKCKAGRPDLQNFIGALVREDKKIGIFIALTFASTFTKEVARLKRENGITITALTVDDILKGNYNTVDW